MEFLPIVLKNLLGREEDLSKIKRYFHENFPVMFYRTNDLIHSRRVLWHLEEAIPNILSVYGTGFETEFARTLALVHDDVEILTGDIQLHEKEKMNKGELELLAKNETESLPRIIEKYGSTANGFDYAELLTAAKEKTRLEAQFVSFFDKFDGAGESWHEVWAGNSHFLVPAGGRDGQNGGYVRRLREFPIKYPDMARFFEQYPSYLPTPFNFKLAAEHGKPHTKVSLHEDSGYPPYERWKSAIIKREGNNLLLARREFN